MGKKALGIVFLLVAYNYLFLADSKDHVKIGLVFLAVDAALWLPQLLRKLKLV